MNSSGHHGGLYLVTVLRKTGIEETIYAKHQDLKQAIKHHSQKHESLVATVVVGKFFVIEEAVGAPRVIVRASVFLVLDSPSRGRI